jgi:phosphatidate phosphatase APP1
MTFIRSPLIFKVEVIKPLIASFPDRKFVLVGDDGQQDPGTGALEVLPHGHPCSLEELNLTCRHGAEVYAEIAEAFPDQVLHVFIHHVNGTNEVPRLRLLEERRTEPH